MSSRSESRVFLILATISTTFNVKEDFDCAQVDKMIYLIFPLIYY